MLELALSRAGLTCVDERHLVGMVNLVVLELEENNLTSVATAPCYSGTPVDVDGLSIPQFQYVLLKNNQLTSIPCLPDATVAELFDAKDNAIISIVDICMPVAKTLLFDNNNLVTFPAFQQVPQSVIGGILRLEFRRNNMGNLPLAHIEPLIHLQNLMLSHNQLLRLPNLAFCHKTLKAMEARYNDITDFDSIFLLADPLSVWDALLFIRSSFNKITSISSQVLVKMPMLAYLTLAGNHIAAFPLGVVDMLPALVELLLYSNNMTSVGEMSSEPLAFNVTVNLMDNQLKCDRNLCWMVGFSFEEKGIDMLLEDAPCHWPPHLVGEEMSQFTPFHIGCYSEFAFIFLILYHRSEQNIVVCMI